MLIGGGVAALTVDDSSGPKGFTLVGTFLVSDKGNFYRDGDSCAGRDVYDDVQVGTAVVVKNESGKILATDALSVSKFSEGSGCVLAFTVKDVPDAKFYTIAVGRRGDLTYSKQELHDRGDLVMFQLGS